jgi:holo-[acyl-carrier protein] synthase
MDGIGCIMIAIGIDIQSIDEFAAASSLLETNLCFTEAECTHSERAPSGAIASLAGIFAAKEALLKALPNRPLCYWVDIEVTYDRSGRPMFQFYGELARWIEALRWNVIPTISHSGNYALALAVVDHNK